MRNEFSQALRSLLHAPVFAATAVVMLAMGIGASTALFALVNTVLIRPLPYAAAPRLISLGSRMPSLPAFAGERLGLAEAQYFFLAGKSRTLEDIGAFDSYAKPVTLTGDGPAEQVEPAYVSASLFDVLGLRAELGRTITASDDRPGARGKVAILGHDLWARRYGGNPDVVGRLLTVDGQRIPIIGVLKAGMHLPGRRVDLWLPLGADPAAPARNRHYLSAIGHIRVGIPFADMRKEIDAITDQLPQAFPNVYASSIMQQSGFATDVVHLKEEVVGSTGRILWMLLAAVSLVLVIACANVANFVLVRANTKRRERAIRVALGAGRVHLARQYLIESLLITGVAAIAALTLATITLKVFVTAAPWEIPRLNEIQLRPLSVAFAIVAAAVAGIVLVLLQLVGLAPSLTIMREDGRGTTLSRRRRAVQRLFVASQVGMALVLLSASGMMIRSVRDLVSIEPGFNSKSVLAVEVSLPASRYQTAERTSAAWEQLIGQLGGLGSVTHVAATQHAPLDGSYPCAGVFVEGQPWTSPSELPPCVDAISVTPGFFETLQIPVRGNPPSWLDNDARSGGVVVSEALAERFWRHENAIGKGIRPNGDGPPYYRVVGVAGNVRDDGLDKPPVESVYLPMLPLKGAPLWEAPRVMTLLIRTNGRDPVSLVPEVRRILESVEADAPVTSVQTMDAILASATGRIRFVMVVLSLASITALLLSCIGLYTVIAYVTAQRRAEITIRLALGAQPGQILRSVITQSIALALVGIVFGLVALVALRHVLQSLLVEVNLHDPAVLTSASLVVIVAATIAGYVPARSAARLAPTEIIR